MWSTGSGRSGDFAASAQESAITDNFAALGRHDAAVDEDVVTEVDVRLPGRERVLADVRQREHRLQPRAVALLEGGEAELAGVPDEDDPAGDADDVVGLLAGLEVAVRGTDLGQRVKCAAG